MIPTGENAGTYSSILLQNEKASLGVRKDEHCAGHKKKSGSRCGGLLGTLLRRRIQRTERDLIPKAFRTDEVQERNEEPTCFFAAQTVDELSAREDEPLNKHLPECLENQPCSQPSSYFSSLFKTGDSFKQALSSSIQPFSTFQTSQGIVDPFPCSYLEMVQKQTGFAVKAQDTEIDLNSKQETTCAHPYLTSCNEMNGMKQNAGDDDASSDLYSSSSCSPAPSSIGSASLDRLDFPSADELTQMSETSRSLWSCFLEQHNKYKSIDFLKTEFEAVGCIKEIEVAENVESNLDQCLKAEDGLSTEVLVDALQTSDPLFATSEEDMLWAAPQEHPLECDSEWSAINL
eukprot:768025-Hanusia_phi.AAC.1